MMVLFDELDQLKEEIDSLRPLDPILEARIMQKFRLDWNYHSNSIEGNKLTFGETKTFLLHGITADGKPLKDHLDIKGHNEAILLLEDIVGESRPVTQNFIRELHKLILQEDYYNDAITPNGEKTRRKIVVGQYKQVPNHVKTKTGEIFHFASPEETPSKMNDLMDWLLKELEKDTIHIVEIAAKFHYKFIRIHPFDDGNGRLARILMNLLVMRKNFPPIIIKQDKKEDYYGALQKADGGNLSSFITYIAAQSKDSMLLYLKGARGEDIEDLDDVDKEFELFKQGLLGESENVLLDKDSLPQILNSHVKVLFDALNKKVFKCNDLYFKTKFGFRINKNEGSFLIEEKFYDDKSELWLNVFNNFDEVLADLLHVGKIETLRIILNWSHFKKSPEHITNPDKFDFEIIFFLSFEDYYFTIGDNFGGKETFFYNKNIETFAIDYSNSLLKRFMTHIKDQLKE